MTFSHVAVLLVFILTIGAGVAYAFKIIHNKVTPTISTWLIFLTGTSMSFASYLVSTKRSFAAGALNGADVFCHMIVILSTLLFGGASWKLRSFEKYYLLGLAAIAFFWLTTSDAFHSNLLIQILLTLAYIPTMHTIIKFKKNTESFLVWGMALAAAVIALYPARQAWLTSNNILGVIYSGRSAVLIAILMTLMCMFRKESIAWQEANR